MGVHWGYTGATQRLHWGYTGATQGLYWGYTGVRVGPYWGYEATPGLRWAIFGLHWGYAGATLDLHWIHWARLGLHRGLFLHAAAPHVFRFSFKAVLNYMGIVYIH